MMARRCIGIGVLTAVLAGCAAGPPGGADAAECPVCRENGDLACLRVTVTDATPRVEYAGRVYYFCSDECRAEFERHPEKYAAK